MDLLYIQHIYQQWAHGQYDAAERWWEFVEWISKMNRVNTEELVKELQKCAWFKQGD